MVFGERSEEVRWLQKALKQYGFFPANVLETGYYGTITQKAVKDFQYFYKVASSIELLIVNGKRVGVKTRRKLNELTIY
jgi:peptidoglycan hydrolase-like protein with peptidoglycan-binding domain